MLCKLIQAVFSSDPSSRVCDKNHATLHGRASWQRNYGHCTMLPMARWVHQTHPWQMMREVHCTTCQGEIKGDATVTKSVTFMHLNIGDHTSIIGLHCCSCLSGGTVPVLFRVLLWVSLVFLMEHITSFKVNLVSPDL